MAGRLSAMISSTARDLPAHRKEVGEACLRQGVFPVMMERLPASDADAIAASLRMVDDADVYLGVFAHRYGYVPAGQRISITEMEYDRAVERRRSRLLFFMHDDHPIKAADVEKGEAAVKLEAFKERLKADRVAGFFKSPEELRGQVIEALAQVRPRDLTAFHRDSTIPAPPEPYVAHPYTLLQTRGLVGRRTELALLDEWAGRSGPDTAVFCLVALGGMGKSALTWTWFHDHAAERLRLLAGRLWWSFYESDATFENFILCALAYVSGQDRESLRGVPAPEREARLLAVLDRERYLIVLDGLERVLNAYARMDAARLSDDDLDQRTANAVGVRHQLRKATDPRAGAFLRRLAQVRASRVLVSSRLYPADLQTAAGQPLPGCRAHFLSGLADADAVALWQALGVNGSREGLLHLFRRFDNYPLLIRALAGEVARYRRAPGDFDRWRQDHPDFDPARLELVQVKSHVLTFALAGLDEASCKTLHTIAAFRMPATYDTLVALLVGPGKAFGREQSLDATLTELEDRDLLGWDRAANRYDLHPVVRGVAWEQVGEPSRQRIYTSLQTHFEALPQPGRWEEVKSLEDVTALIELYNTLLGLGRYEDAYALIHDRLYRPLHLRLGASRQLAELLEGLFPAGDNSEPPMSVVGQAWAITLLAHTRRVCGQPKQAACLYRRATALFEKLGHSTVVTAGLVWLAPTLRQCGLLSESEAMARRALLVFQQIEDNAANEADNLRHLGLTLASRDDPAAEKAFSRAFRLCRGQEFRLPLSLTCLDACQHALWQGRIPEALDLANEARRLATQTRVERNQTRAVLMLGVAALANSTLRIAEESLHLALTQARFGSFTEEEVAALVGLAELRCRQGDLIAARTMLDDVWEPVDRGPYPLFHADALNVLAQIERDAGHAGAAIDAATKAYRLAWCDGPPFAYHWGLEAAKAHLAALGAPEPADLPLYDESHYEPLPHVEIDPPDYPIP
jgi:tetratricopeptide (TPR) repeat protein